MISLNALFSTYFTLCLLLNLNRGRNADFKINIQQVCVLGSVFGEMFERSLLGSFPWFDQVPLLKTLEAILEDAALWLQRQGIVTGEEGKEKERHTAPTKYPIPIQIIQSIQRTKYNLSIIL